MKYRIVKTKYAGDPRLYFVVEVEKTFLFFFKHWTSDLSTSKTDFIDPHRRPYYTYEQALMKVNLEIANDVNRIIQDQSYSSVVYTCDSSGQQVLVDEERIIDKYVTQKMGEQDVV